MKIAIIDDDIDYAALLKRNIRRVGASMGIDNLEVYVLSNTDTLFDYLDKNYGQLNLMLIDTRLPGKPGYELCREIYNRYSAPRVPAVAISGISEEDSIDKWETIGVQSFIRKDRLLSINMIVDYQGPDSNIVPRDMAILTGLLNKYK